MRIGFLQHRLNKGSRGTWPKVICKIGLAPELVCCQDHMDHGAQCRALLKTPKARGRPTYCRYPMNDVPRSVSSRKKRQLR